MEKVTADVIIIGKGIIGYSIAYQLSKRKAKVVVLEKEGTTSGSSGEAYSRTEFSVLHLKPM